MLPGGGIHLPLRPHRFVKIGLRVNMQISYNLEICRTSGREAGAGVIRMTARPSERIAEFVQALPLRADMRVLEIGCGPGVAARLVAERLVSGYVLAIDRSAKAIALAEQASLATIATGRLEFRRVAVEDFLLEPGERPYDLAFAMRVGALDGRHPKIEQAALARLRAALVPGGSLFLDGGSPLKEIRLG
jgi:cyclopropane fatty-acyl-phospholipid synthase-like methyltransferase